MRNKRLLPVALLVLLAPSRMAGQARPADVDPRIEKLVAAVSQERLQQLLQKLSSFKTRNTLSDPGAANGLGEARQWIVDELKRSSPKLQVSFDTHVIPQGGRITKETELRNVIAVLPGKSPRRIYVSGHYDSLNLGTRGQEGLNTAAPAAPAGGAAPGGQPAAGQPAAGQGNRADPNLVAPGANDDGSGTVLSMELARVFAESGIDFEATLVFMTVAGEEQGLVGSGAHAKKAKADNIPVQALFNNDIVGGAVGGDGTIDGATVRLYSEGPEDSPSRALAQFTRRVAERYVPSHRVRLMARRDRFSRGGDHSAFNASGFAAVGFRESRENYAKQHSANDTIDGVSFSYLAQNARVNAAAMATLALAPPPPVVVTDRGAPTIDRRPSGYDAHLRWTASPGAQGYRIFWRDAWAPDWQHEMYVGNVTEYVLPHKNIDDFVFGVAAVSAGGHESTISAYVAPPRADGGS
jgi:peptidase M28-like protein